MSTHYLKMNIDYRIGFGRPYIKCRDCKAVSHPTCKDLVPLPCIATGNTPTLRGMSVCIYKKKSYNFKNKN